MTRRGALLAIELPTRTLHLPARQARWPAAVPGVPQRALLPEGAELEFDSGTDLRPLRGRRPGGAAAWLERRWAVALVAVLLVGIAGSAAVRFGIPAAARHLAFSLPVQAQQALGRGTLETLDQMLLTDSELPPADAARAQALFAEVRDRLAPQADYRLVLRHAPELGANALALPDGTVVLTDALVQLADDSDGLAAVMAHEIGHLEQRHALQAVLRGSALALLIGLATGDAGSLAGLAAAAPGLLIQAGYARGFELEADRWALRYMHEAGIDPRAFAALLRRFEGSDQTGLAAYLSTHPLTEDRIAGLDVDTDG